MCYLGGGKNMKDSLLKKSLVIGIIILFVGANIVLIICGNIGKIKSLSSKEENDEIGMNTLGSDLVDWWRVR